MSDNPDSTSDKPVWRLKDPKTGETVGRYTREEGGFLREIVGEGEPGSPKPKPKIRHKLR